MNNPTNNKATAIITTAIILITFSLITFGNQNENINLYPTQFSAANQAAEMQVTEETPAEMPSSLEMVTNSIQNSIEQTKGYFQDALDDINRQYGNRNYNNYVAYSNR
ncbi:MAG: hypothetical protein ACPG49_01100 [Chitinophagales bacterium]